MYDYFSIDNNIWIHLFMKLLRQNKFRNHQNLEQCQLYWLEELRLGFLFSPAKSVRIFNKENDDLKAFPWFKTDESILEGNFMHCKNGIMYYHLAFVDDSLGVDWQLPETIINKWILCFQWTSILYYEYFI